MPTAHNGSVELYYETFGSPTDEAMLLVNGHGSQCINFDVELCEMFVSRGYFVIRFDNRDVGLSTKFDHFRPNFRSVQQAMHDGTAPNVAYDLSDMADDAVAVLDALGFGRAHAMGVSMGGMIVQQLAIDHPERLTSMTSIMSTTGDRDVGRTAPEVLDLYYGPRTSDRDQVILVSQAIQRLCASPAFYDENRVAQRVGTAFDRCFCPDGVSRQLSAIIASGSRANALRAVQVPALIIHGDRDTLIDMSGGQHTAECIPNARYVVIDGMGHDCPPQLFERWVQLVTEHARAASTTQLA
jgi:pimeloyl-ACP methyl ester carboxylesterase